MIRQSSGDGSLDLLAVQRDDELLDRLGGRVALQSDDAMVQLLVTWRDEVDDGLPRLVPAPRAEPVMARPAGVDLLPSPASGQPRRRRLTATGTAAALVLGGTLSLSGVAAAVTGDPLAPYRAVGHALSIGGSSLPEHAAELARLNKGLSRARAAVAHGDLAGAQAAVDGLAAQLAGADLTDEQRAAIERRLASLRTAVARGAAAEAERGRNQDRATAVTTPPPHGADGRGADGDASGSGGHEPAGGDDDQGEAGAGGDATRPESDDPSPPAAKPSKPAAPERVDPADGDPPADTTEQAPADLGENGEDGEDGGDAGDQPADRSGTAGDAGDGAARSGEPATPGRSAEVRSSAAVEQAAPGQPAAGEEARPPVAWPDGSGPSPSRPA